MNDERIISAIRHRNEAAINEVIRKYSKLLWSVSDSVLSKIGSTQDIEECVADTFIYLWEHPNKYDPVRGKLKTWLSIIARTQAINRYREITKRDTVSLADIEFMDQLGIVDNILKEEVRHNLIAAVSSWGEPVGKFLLRLFYYKKRRRKFLLGGDMSEKQVDNRLYQTKLKLREALSN